MSLQRYVVSSRCVPIVGLLKDPSFRLTENDSKYSWTEDSELAFRKLKHVFTSEPLLVYPVEKLMFIFDCDVSDLAIVSVLSQLSERK